VYQTLAETTTTTMMMTQQGAPWKKNIGENRDFEAMANGNIAANSPLCQG